MKRSKIYFTIGIVLLQCGAFLIHWGLGLIFIGALMLFCSYLEFEENHEDKKEEE
jgi:hypothetical protein